MKKFRFKEDHDLELSLKYIPDVNYIIIGIPGINFLGTIINELLIEGLNAEHIGRFIFKDLSPLLGIHNKKFVEQFALYYSKENKTMILNPLKIPVNLEWKISKIINELANHLNIDLIITIEGLISNKQEKNNIFHLMNFPPDNIIREKIKDIPKIEEGIIIGITAALLMESDHKVLSLFSNLNIKDENQTDISEKAINIINLLNDMLNLKINQEKINENAKIFENKIKTIINKTKSIKENHEKDLDYLG